MHGTRLLLYAGHIFKVDQHVFYPDAYSEFFDQHLEVNPGCKVLDLTTGCGFHAITMAARGAKVIGVDVSKESAACAAANVIINGMTERVEIRCGDLFAPVQEQEDFDLIVACPPVMPTPPGCERRDWIGLANDAGPDGRQVIDRIVVQAARFLRKRGRLQLLQPGYTDVNKTLHQLTSLGYDSRVIAEAKFPVGQLSFERRTYLAELGFPFPVDDATGEPYQLHSIIAGTKQ